MAGKQDNASTREEQLVAALGSRQHQRSEIQLMIKDLPADERFVLREAWLAVVTDAGQEAWRRLLAYKLLVGQGVSYPASLETFWSTVVAPLGIDRSKIVDMTMGSHVPVQRSADLAVNMVSLSIATPTGTAALYYSVHRSSGEVVEAAVSPDP